MKRVKSGVANALIEVDDITSIIDLCESLDIGDLVAENKNNVKKLYRVSKRGESELALSYVDNEQSSIVSFSRDSSGVWSYVETKETELDGGGTKLYKHVFTLELDGGEGGTYNLIAITPTQIPYTTDDFPFSDEVNFKMVFVRQFYVPSVDEMPSDPVVSLNFLGGENGGLCVGFLSNNEGTHVMTYTIPFNYAILEDEVLPL